MGCVLVQWLHPCRHELQASPCGRQGTSRCRESSGLGTWLAPESMEGRHLLLSLQLLGLQCSEFGATKTLWCIHRDCSSPRSPVGCLETEEGPKAGWKQTPREIFAPAAYLDEMDFPCALNPRGQDFWPQATIGKEGLAGNWIFRSQGAWPEVRAVRLSELLNPDVTLLCSVLTV